MNISFDLARLKRSRNEKRFLLLRFFNMLLHSATNIGVICMAPHELPLTAFTSPSLSTCIMASITGFQSKSGAFASTLSAATRFPALLWVHTPVKHNNNNTTLKIFIIKHCFWDSNLFRNQETVRENALRLYS